MSRLSKGRKEALENEAEKWFNMNVKSPYMLIVAKIKDNKSYEMSQKEKKLLLVMMED